MDEKENKNETKSETSLLIKKLDGTEMSMEESNRFLMVREEWKTRYMMLPADLPPQETFKLTMFLSSLVAKGKQLYLHFDINGTIKWFDSINQIKNPDFNIDHEINEVLCKNIIGTYDPKKFLVFDFYIDQPFLRRGLENEMSLYDFFIATKQNAKEICRNLFGRSEESQTPLYLLDVIIDQIQHIPEFLAEQIGLFVSFHLVQAVLKNFPVYTIFHTFGIDGPKILEELWSAGLIDRMEDVAHIKVTISMDSSTKETCFVYTHVESGKEIQPDGLTEFYTQFKYVIQIENYEHWKNHQKSKKEGKQIFASGYGDYHFLFDDLPNAMHMIKKDKSDNIIFFQTETIQAMMNSSYYLNLIVDYGMAFLLREEIVDKSL